MITLEHLYAFTKSEVTAQDNEQVTLVFGPEATAEQIILSLLDCFGRRGKQQAVRLVVGGEERGYLMRTALYSLMPLGGTRGIGEADGASLAGDSSGLALIESCCPVARCTEILLVTEFNEQDPPMCPLHGVAMERRK